MALNKYEQESAIKIVLVLDIAPELAIYILEYAKRVGGASLGWWLADSALNSLITKDLTVIQALMRIDSYGKGVTK